MPVDNLSDRMQTIGNYDLVEKIAEGGMGTVYRGRHHLTGETVAVKVVPQHLLSNPVVLKRFEQEYNVARSIDHPNIVKALDFGREGDQRYLVMEYVDGESLGQKIERDGRMDETEAIRIISEVALGLQSAHNQGMIHRDVKPDNILITAEGQVKLTDLGLVKEVDAELNLTRTGRGLGTPHFMAPEQFRNAKKADARCDIYSLGATLYMMVTGQLPFQSNGPLDAWMKKINNDIEAPRTVIATISERMDWAIRRAISPDPLNRPECCREFIEDLTGHTTKQLIGTAAGVSGGSAYWYLVYNDDEGVLHSVKGTIKGIRRSFKEGLLGDAENIRVAATKAGPFEPLRQRPEFRDLVIEPGSMAMPWNGSARADSLKPSDTTTDPTIDGVPATALDSSVLTTTSLGMPAVQPADMPKTAPPTGPRINLSAARSSRAADYFVWLVLLLFFGSLGVVATYLLPTVIRYIRFM